jgi:putative transposase
MFERNRTRPFLIRYVLYLYFLGLSLISTSKALKPFVDRSYVAIWYWIQEFNPKNIFPNKKNSGITAFIIDETAVRSERLMHGFGLPRNEYTIRFHKILGVYISRHRNMLVAEAFLKSLVKLYGKHIVYSDGGSWYPEA